MHLQRDSTGRAEELVSGNERFTSFKANSKLKKLWELKKLGRVRNTKLWALGGDPGAPRSLCNSKDQHCGTDVALKLDKWIGIHLPGL